MLAFHLEKSWILFVVLVNLIFCYLRKIFVKDKNNLSIVVINSDLDGM